MTAKEHLNDLREIRSIMDRSTRFLSLSGLAGILAGIFALIGGYAAYDYLKEVGLITNSFQTKFTYFPIHKIPEVINFIIIDGGLVLLLAISGGIFFGIRKSRKDNIKLWSSATKRLIINLAIPLVAGAIFCAILYHHYLFALIAPCTLIFYGMALLNAGKYTLNEIRYLGISEIILGLISAFYLSYGLLSWMIGFGILHIIYGSIMYFKYER